jgi:hypothetical protein
MCELGDLLVDRCLLCMFKNVSVLAENVFVFARRC